MNELTVDAIEADKHIAPPKKRKMRGRARSDKKADQVENSRVELLQDRDVAAHSSDKPARVPMGSTLPYEFGNACTEKDKYHYHVISDREGRIERVKQAWYEHVVDSSGNNVCRHGGRYTQYLMRVELKYWEEDQKLKQRKVTGTMQSVQTLSKDEYLPDGRKHVLERDLEDYDPLA